MKTRGLAVLAGLAVLLAGAAVPAHAAKYKVRWFLGHKNLDYFEEAAKDFKRTVETASRGDIAVEIVPAASDEAAGGATQGVSSPEIAAKVEKGEIEMGHSFTDVVGSVDPRLYAFGAPYLFRDYKHVEGAIEGPVGAGMLASFEKRGMIGLSFTYSGGANGVAADREIRSPADLKGLKVGVFGDEVDAAWLKSLGATPVAVRHDLDKILAMKRAGSLDAVVITWRNFERASLNAGFKYFNLPGSTYLASVTYANKKFFDGLPAEYRALLLKASQEAGRVERAKTIELNEAARREMVGKGVTPTYLSAAARAEFVRAVEPAYRGSIDGLLGKAFLDSVRQAPDGALPKTGGLASR
ncbi:MAG: TRAP transporter substrate-binding protein [Elusimicrobia bacterium]|nr:TRAP transporter substrate-binding protein [Elusimicrobiota bacterium]